MKNPKYQCKVESHEHMSIMTLSVTHNGKSWASIRIGNPSDEIPKLIRVLKKALKEET